MNTYTTPAGKEIQFRVCPKTAQIKIEFASGGELPVDLSGIFTSEREAERAVMMYIDKAKIKATKVSK